jgi:nicotinate-nucleotide pyrophosphorylase (carboxylating)
VIDKYAVRCGGGQNHRLDLSDGVLIKGNHIALAGGAPALERAMRNRRGRQPIEIEVRSLEELQQALDHGAEAILLDHVSVETCAKRSRSVRGSRGGFRWSARAESIWRTCERTRRRAWILFRSER